MSLPQILAIIALAVLAAAALGWLVVLPWIRRGPRGDVAVGVLWRLLRVYVRLLHRPTYVGTDRLPADDDDHHGLIVVSNHTSSVDPLLIQARCRFWIRWMMATDTMIEHLDWLWRQQRVIPVERNGRDTKPLREAIRHTHHGGCLGIFPEGRIVNPPEQVRPFFPGVGVLVARAKKPVLLVWVSNTPRTTDMFKALRTPSRSRVEFIDVIEFDDDADAETITQTLRKRLAEHSGWPLNDEPQPKGDGPAANRSRS
jgi:1-acyl-sn-glycerol-3-phosphate acyltransferase